MNAVTAKTSSAVKILDAAARRAAFFALNHDGVLHLSRSSLAAAAGVSLRTLGRQLPKLLEEGSLVETDEGIVEASPNDTELLAEFIKSIPEATTEEAEAGEEIGLMRLDVGSPQVVEVTPSADDMLTSMVKRRLDTGSLSGLENSLNDLGAGIADTLGMAATPSDAAPVVRSGKPVIVDAPELDVAFKRGSSVPRPRELFVLTTLNVGAHTLEELVSHLSEQTPSVTAAKNLIYVMRRDCGWVTRDGAKGSFSITSAGREAMSREKAAPKVRNANKNNKARIAAALAYVATIPNQSSEIVEALNLILAG